MLLTRLVLFLCLACWGCFSLGGQQAEAQGASRQQFAGWLDRKGTATVDDVQQLAQWVPFTGWQGWAFGPEPVWLRIHVPAAADGALPSVLVMHPPYLDRVIFYDPDLGIERRAGDFYPATDDAIESGLFTFAVPAQPAAREVFIKLQSTSTRVVHLSLLPERAAKAYVRKVDWLTGSAWLLSLVFTIWGVVQWLMTGDRVTGIFAVKQACITLWGFFFLGFARVAIGPLFPDGVLSLISSMVVAATVSTVLWFFAALLVEYKARPWMLAVMSYGVVAIAGVGLLNLVGQTRLALQIVNAVAPFMLLWVALTTLAARIEDARTPIPRIGLLAYVCVYALLNSIPAMTHLGLVEETRILFVGNMGLLVLDGLIMLVILTVRQHRFRQQHQAMALQLMVQQDQARRDQQYLDEQRKLLAMLAHEMKTPLANLRVWMEAGVKGRPVMARAIDDMNRVIERCVHSGQLADQSLKPHWEWIDAAELTQSVAKASRDPDRLSLVLPREVCELRTDVQMLSIVFSNVLENAYKYSPPGSRIELQLENEPRPDGHAGWRWVVGNEVGAAGFPDGDKVFDKYYRSPQAKRQSGSGLGLFLVKSLLGLMHGQVRYIPLEGRVRFEIRMPADPAPTAAHG